MNEYVKAALQTIASVGAFVGLCVLAYNNGDIAKDIVAYSVIGFVCFYFLYFIFEAFLVRNLRKSGKYKEPDVNCHYG